MNSSRSKIFRFVNYTGNQSGIPLKGKIIHNHVWWNISKYLFHAWDLANNTH